MASSIAALSAASTPELKRASAKRLREAAEVIAVRARAISATFSKRIPASIKITGGTTGVYIIAGGPDGKEAPNAYPFEYGVRHPLFGNRNHWYAQPKRPFLEEAAVQAADAAAEAFAAVLDDWTKTLDL